MQSVIVHVIVAVGVTMASDPRVYNSEDGSSSTKRLLITPSQHTQIKGGFDAASHLLDSMDKLDFGGVTSTLIGSVSGFLGAVSPFVGFVLSLFGGPSPEYQLLKKMFTHIENRFDQVDVQFAALRRHVSFVATQVHFTDLESNINAVQAALKTFSRVTNMAEYKYESHEFKRTFDRTYHSSGIKLFNALIHGGLTTGGLFYEFLVYRNYDRKESQRFMIGTLNLLIRAAALELAYAQLRHAPNIDSKRREWVSHFSQVKNKMMAIDNEIVKNSHNQTVRDINEFATLHPKGTLSNADFSSQLYSKLSNKYFWRDWFVLVSAPYDHWNLAVHACDYNQHDYKGRTIAIASVDKTKRHFGSSSIIRNFHLKLYTQYIIRPGSRYGYRCTICSMDQFPDSVKNQCNSYAAAGVICTKNTDIHIRSSRMSSYNPHGANEAFLFG